MVRLAALPPDDRSALLELYDEVAASPLRPGWSYDEPSELEAIVATLPTSTPAAADWTPERIHGGWLGRIAGCMVGKPLEQGWTAAQTREYLAGVGAYPLRDYVPAADPPTTQLHWTWPETTLGRIDGGVRDDDIDYVILGLLLQERFGNGLSTADVAGAWLSYLDRRADPRRHLRLDAPR